MAVLGGTYPDHQVLVVMEFRGLGGDVAVRTQYNAVNHDVMAGKENRAQILEPFPDGLNGFQNGFSVDALFKIQAPVKPFRQGGGKKGTGQGQQAGAGGEFHDHGGKKLAVPFR